MNRKMEWSIEDLNEFIGQPESSRLEFKSSRLLEKNKSEYINDLTKEISAFANSEGGIIIIGIEEDKRSKPPIAHTISEGVNRRDFPLNWFQQVIESNLSPYLPNIHFYSVPINKKVDDRVAFVIDIPQGSTAYQANDRRYYGRSEFEVKPLPDHEIRLRMLKKQVANAFYEFEKDSDSQCVKFKTFIRNIGYCTIENFLLKIEFESNNEFLCKDKVTSELINSKVHYFDFPEQASTYYKSLKIYPDQRIEFPFSQNWVVGNFDIDNSSGCRLICKWTIYLDNSPSVNGEMDIFSLFK